MGAAEEAVDDIRQSLTVWTAEEFPYDRGVGLVNLSIAQGILGILSEDAQMVREGLSTLAEVDTLYAGLGYDDGGTTAGLREQFESFIPIIEGEGAE